jgi:hypothetical protein
MRRLKYVGNFQELGWDDDPSAPCMADCRGGRLGPNKQNVVDYLRAGATIVFSPGIDADVFDRNQSAGTSSMVTDGTYVWPAVLAYYVDKHDVALPAEFEAHMEAHGWRVPEWIDKSSLLMPGDRL